MARKKQAIALRNTTDVRRYIASIINRVEAGELDPKLSGRLGYLSNVLTKVIELETFERRLNLLEKAVETRDLVNVTPGKQIIGGKA